MSDTLKPCPFCGSKAEVWQNDGSTVWNVRCGSTRRCQDFPVPAMERDTREEAIAAWNTRALDAASYRAGLEAAAKLFEEQAKLSSDAAWSEQLCEMAGEIRALPTPSTLPEEPQC